MEELRKEIEEILEKIEKCADENQLIKLRNKLSDACIRYCNYKMSEIIINNKKTNNI